VAEDEDLGSRKTSLKEKTSV